MNREKLESIRKELNWEPAPPSNKPGVIHSVKVIGNIGYVSGHVAFSKGELLYKGRIGKDVSIEDGKKSAALAVLNCLESIDKAVGLENVESVLKVTGFLCCAEDVTAHPEIMNAASKVLIDVFGEEVGKHARSALGIHTLPLGASTEVEMIISIKA